MKSGAGGITDTLLASARHPEKKKESLHDITYNGN